MLYLVLMCSEQVHFCFKTYRNHVIEKVIENLRKSRLLLVQSWKAFFRLMFVGRGCTTSFWPIWVRFRIMLS